MICCAVGAEADGRGATSEDVRHTGWGAFDMNGDGPTSGCVILDVAVDAAVDGSSGDSGTAVAFLRILMRGIGGRIRVGLAAFTGGKIVWSGDTGSGFAVELLRRENEGGKPVEAKMGDANRNCRPVGSSLFGLQADCPGVEGPATGVVL